MSSSFAQGFSVEEEKMSDLMFAIVAHREFQIYPRVEYFGRSLKDMKHVKKQYTDKNVEQVKRG